MTRKRRKRRRPSGTVPRVLPLKEELLYATVSAVLVLTPVILMLYVKGCERQTGQQARTKSDGQQGPRTARWGFTQEDADEQEKAKKAEERALAEASPQPTASSADIYAWTDAQDAHGSPGDHPREQIPEPATSTLLLTGCVWLWARRRRPRSRGRDDHATDGG